MEQKEEVKKVEIKFPLIFLRTESFQTLFEWFGKRRITKSLSWFALYLMPIMAAIGTYLILNSIVAILTRPEVSEVQRSLGPQSYIMLPGINPYLPIVYGWAGILVGIIVHEGAHGIVARSLGYSVKSSGLLFLLAIPIGAFVDVDENELEERRAKDTTRVMAAGPAMNIIIGIVCLLLLANLVHGMQPRIDGIYVFEVIDGMPAKEAGIMPRDLIVEVNGIKVHELEELSNILSKKKADDIVILTIARGEYWEEKFSIPIKLVEHEGRAMIGVKVGPLGVTQTLENYKVLTTQNPVVFLIPPTLGFSQTFVPFSDLMHHFYTHSIGSIYYPLSQLLFWVWFVNFNLALFNSLPIFPLDGGQALRKVLRVKLENMLGKVKVNMIVYLISIVMVSLVVSMIVLPYLLP